MRKRSAIGSKTGRANVLVSYTFRIMSFDVSTTTFVEIQARDGSGSSLNLRFSFELELATCLCFPPNSVYFLNLHVFFCIPLLHLTK